MKEIEAGQDRHIIRVAVVLLILEQCCSLNGFSVDTRDLKG